MGFGTISWRPNSNSCHSHLSCMITRNVFYMKTLLYLYFQIDLCGMPNLIINRVVRREPVGLAYLKKYMTSLGTPTIALPALSCMTVNFDASLSSSIHYESQSLPTTPTCVYMKSPDVGKSSKQGNMSDNEIFYSAAHEPELKPQSVSNSSSEEDTSSGVLANANNNNSSRIEQQTRQEKGPQLLSTKSNKYIKNLAMAADLSVSNGGVDNSCMRSSDDNHTNFTVSPSSDTSGNGDTVVTNTACSTEHQPVLEESKESAEDGNESVEVPSGQFDIFVSL